MGSRSSAMLASPALMRSGSSSGSSIQSLDSDSIGAGSAPLPSAMAAASHSQPIASPSSLASTSRMPSDTLDPVLALCTAVFPSGEAKTYWFTVVISTRRHVGEAGMMHWPGFIFDSVLFAKLPPASHWNSDADSFNSSILALLELAENCLDCTRVVVCLDKSLFNLPSVLRMFRLIGFELVHPQVYSFGDDFVLCGFEI
ncbi:hypothetical protein BC831DRAFT_508780 [Entophlyctis helioformis]|nr:hypothetical protein BC831DRAFT_508780 [Entophlyctis helioformis]